jgi:hypothetical protein
MPSFGEAVRKAMDTELLDNKDPDAVPKGSYHVRVEGGRAGVAKSSGNEYAVVVFTVLRGPVEGQFEGFFGLGSPTQQDINGNALAGLGIDWDKVDDTTDLDLAIAALKGVTADISVAWNNGFMNVNVHGSRPAEGQAPDISGKPVADFATAASQGADDSVPF